MVKTIVDAKKNVRSRSRTPRGNFKRRSPTQTHTPNAAVSVTTPNATVTNKRRYGAHEMPTNRDPFYRGYRTRSSCVTGIAKQNTHHRVPVVSVKTVPTDANTTHHSVSAVSVTILPTNVNSAAMTEAASTTPVRTPVPNTVTTTANVVSTTAKSSVLTTTATHRSKSAVLTNSSVKSLSSSPAQESSESEPDAAGWLANERADADLSDEYGGVYHWSVKQMHRVRRSIIRVHKLAVYLHTTKNEIFDPASTYSQERHAARHKSKQLLHNLHDTLQEMFRINEATLVRVQPTQDAQDEQTQVGS